MTTPRPLPSHIFTPIELDEHAECIFCNDARGGWYIHVNFPSKDYTFFVHVSCFEQLGWSMSRFVVDNHEKFGTGGIWNLTSSVGTN